MLKYYTGVVKVKPTFKANNNSYTFNNKLYSSL